MLEPNDLYEVEESLPTMQRPVLIEALDGFIDAGGAKRIAAGQLLSAPDARVVARFDVDQLFDYRARRPAMIFVRDHWDSYDAPQLALHAVSDADGVPFLVLAGMEPDVAWERFIAATQQLIARFDVRLTVGLGAIPMAVPHTRPLGVIAHASRPDLLPPQEPWVDTVQVPASAGHLLEYRLGQAGHDAMGLAVHVPHYLSQTDYPTASLRLLEAISVATGLNLPTNRLEEDAQTTQAAINDQVAQSPEVAEVVRGLESQYDLVMAGRDNLLAAGAELPTAEELGAQFERFLSQQTPKGEGA